MSNYLMSAALIAAAVGLSSPAHAGNAMMAAPHLVIDTPAKGETLEGAAIIRFHTENLAIDPEFGGAAAARTPAIGHLHVTVDDLPLLWVYTSKEPIVLAALKPGPHRVKIDLANPEHKVLESQEVSFVMK